MKASLVTVEKLKSPKKTLSFTTDQATSNIIHNLRAALNERVNQIKEQIKSTTSTYDKEKLEERLSKLIGGVGIFKVGGGSEVEVG